MAAGAGCKTCRMTHEQTSDAPAATERRVVSASRDIAAPAATIFELIADPSRQPQWDGNDNLSASESPRVSGVGEIFVMTITKGTDRDNHVVEFEEGRRIAWRPADPGQTPAGHLWRWELAAIGQDRTRVIHTYDWSELTDVRRMVRARETSSSWLEASLARLAALVE